MLWRWVDGRAGRARLGAARPDGAGLPLTVIVAEDARFCIHHGIDLGELREAIEEADDISEMRGGSTITQQIAKNLFLWQGRSFVRKALELPLALWIDLVLRQAADDGNLSQHRRMGPERRVRRRGRRRAMPSASRRAISTRARRRCLPRSCPIRSGAAPAQPGVLVRRLAGIYLRRAAAQPGARVPASGWPSLASAEAFLYKPAFQANSSAAVWRRDDYRSAVAMAVPKRKTSPSRRGMRRSADALKRPTYVEDKDSGELRRPHHIDLKTGMYRGRQVLKVKTEA